MRELYEKVYMAFLKAIFMKRKIICFLLFLFVSSTIFSLKKNGNYYITISERGVLGGVGNFVLNCKTLEIIKKNL